MSFGGQRSLNLGIFGDAIESSRPVDKEHLDKDDKSELKAVSLTNLAEDESVTILSAWSRSRKQLPEKFPNKPANVNWKDINHEVLSSPPS